MPLVYGVLLVSIASKSVLSQIIASVVYAFVFLRKNKRTLVLFIFLSLALMIRYHYQYTPQNLCGRVIQTFDGGYRLDDAFQTYTVFDTQKTYRYERVCVDGTFVPQSGVGTESHFIIQSASTNKTSELPQVLKNIFDAIETNETFQTLFFNASEDFYASMSLQLSAFFSFLTLLLKPRIGTRTLNLVKLGACVLFYLLFGLSFGLARLTLKVFLSTSSQIICLLLLFPGYALKASFLIPYGLVLMNHLSKHIQIKRYSFVNAAFIQMILYRYSLIQQGMYPVFKYLYMPLIPLGFLSFVWKTPATVWLKFVTGMQAMLDSPLLNRFTLVGKFPLPIFLMLLGTHFLQKKTQRIYMYLVTIVMLTYFPFAQTTFINVGQGDAILIQMPFNAASILIDTGRKSAGYHLESVLSKQGVKNLDYLILTHDDLDHTENKDRILKKFGGTLIETKGSQVPFLTELLATSQYQSSNDNSLLFLSANNVLLMGDASIKQERDILGTSTLLCPTVIKLGHHGSQTSSDRTFLKDIKPQLAIASSNPSIYGHPHLSVQRTLYDLDIPLLQTSVHGDITMTHTGIVDIINTSAHFFGIIKPVITCSK